MEEGRKKWVAFLNHGSIDQTLEGEEVEGGREEGGERGRDKGEEGGEKGAEAEEERGFLDVQSPPELRASLSVSEPDWKRQHQHHP